MNQGRFNGRNDVLVLLALVEPVDQLSDGLGVGPSLAEVVVPDFAGRSGCFVESWAQRLGFSI